MGKVLSVITRPIKNYNVEHRAHKIISKEKPIPAPHYQSDIEQVEKLLKENPESLTKLLKKDTQLDARLRDIYVKSYDPIQPKPITEPNPDRPLPLDRRVVEMEELGIVEPKKVPPGRITLRNVLKLLTNRHWNSKTWDSQKEAINYNIPIELLENITKYFQVYQVFIPEDNKRVVFGAPKLPKQKKIETKKDDIL